MKEKGRVEEYNVEWARGLTGERKRWGGGAQCRVG